MYFSLFNIIIMFVFPTVLAVLLEYPAVIEKNCDTPFLPLMIKVLWSKIMLRKVGTSKLHIFGSHGLGLVLKKMIPIQSNCCLEELHSQFSQRNDETCPIDRCIHLKITDLWEPMISDVAFYICSNRTQQFEGSLQSKFGRGAQTIASGFGSKCKQWFVLRQKSYCLRRGQHVWAQG